MSKKSIFLEDFNFRGPHEEKARALINTIDEKTGTKVFSIAIELYMVAACIGCRLERRSKPDKSGQGLRIFATQFTSRYKDLMFLFKLVLLSSNYNNLEPIDRVNRAFRNYSDDEYAELFEEYVLGGVDELYDYFFNKKNLLYDDYLNTMIEVINMIRDLDEGSDTQSDEEIYNT